MEELKLIIEAVNGLGAGAKDAFLFYLGYRLLVVLVGWTGAGILVYMICSLVCKIAMPTVRFITLYTAAGGYGEPMQSEMQAMIMAMRHSKDSFGDIARHSDFWIRSLSEKK